ncbi:hypothetical protein HMPREF1230_2056 [Streptococcus pyogenes GA19681]|nr:hypothetical protein HMPREF1228_0880 [Streptococcus pyogenes GA41345]EQL81714.1 hypothetical protein HMPREF1230_2056 [Streptococcus pyogenes GA19681]ERL08979.1 hypothetical protein HMPREF1231_1433 [Streptococcus pyogenes GA06023]ESA54898.1 hypothetical protein HMPREF1232_1314 [Streptococcus pyogenes GA40468]ESU90962.1 hypothetical protein HMPREF1240_1881 [Streptococcus pyogenes GA03455]
MVSQTMAITIKKDTVNQNKDGNCTAQCKLKVKKGKSGQKDQILD